MVNARAVISTGIVLLLAAAVLFVLIVPNGGAREPRASDPSPTESPVSDGHGEDRGDPTPLAVPTPDTTGRDFDRIFREISAFRDWLYENPDPDLVSFVFAEQCACYESARDQFEELRTSEMRFDSEPTTVHEVHVIEEGRSEVVLEVLLESGHQRLVDRSGEVLDSTSGTGPEWFEFGLSLRGDRWLVASIDGAVR
jgi:hypothetical protein